MTNQSYDLSREVALMEEVKRNAKVSLHPAIKDLMEGRKETCRCIFEINQHLGIVEDLMMHLHDQPVKCRVDYRHEIASVEDELRDLALCFQQIKQECNHAFERFKESRNR